jgi:TatD DNase family protein
LEWASDLDVPVIVHTRDSMEEAVSMVEEHVRVHPRWGAHDGGHHRGVFHCFTGGVEHAERLFASGFYISFPGIVTFKNNPAAATVRTVGLDRVLVETDSPYLTPVPHRGKRNEPAYVALVANTIAALLGTSLEEVAAATTKNAEVLFRLPTLAS